MIDWQHSIETYPVATGWHASAGKGWAESGATREEAIANYKKAEQRRREILAMPPYHKQIGGSHA